MFEGLLTPPFKAPVLVACAALVLSGVFDIHRYLPLFCGNTADAVSADAILASVRFAIAINPPAMLALAWLAMVVAMMMPLVALPLAHVQATSLATRQWRASAAFLFGYFGIWFCAAPPLLASAFALRLLTGSGLPAFLTALLIALFWSASPLQQAAQNRAHRLRRIGLFGLAADRDCVRFGLILGGWCVANCWAWMLVPLYVSHGHIAAMAASGAIVMAERLKGPGIPRWRVPVILSLILSLFKRPVRARQTRGTQSHV